ncbi:hypothetical protein E4T47_07159 [Aureobasidium subglaciale]|nr:hypothetical protein E4T47_07159 [Aureobasidium subglaciale]
MNPMHEIRMSASPGKAPEVIHQHEVGSPVRSVRPEFLLESINSQAEFGARTFLDNPTPEEETHPPDIPEPHALPQATTSIDQRLLSKQRRSGHYLGGTTEQFQSNCVPERRVPSPPSPRSPVEPTDFEKYQQLTREACKSGFDSDEDSYIGSVEELTPVRPARRSNMLVDGLFHQNSPHVLEEESPILPKSQDLAVARQIKEVHHLTMQALTGISGSSNPPPTPPPISIRDSRYQEWRNSRYRSVSAPAKKVTMAPPPIDTSKITMQQPHIKTPYPFRALHRKEFGRQFSASEPTLRSPRVYDSVVTLSIRRSNPDSRLRISTLTIPANSEFSAVKNRRRSSDQTKEYTLQDFDDAELFRQLRRHYKNLLGPWSHFSARSLTMICVSGDASKQADSGYGWLLTPRSPRTLAYNGLNDTFSEEKLLRFFHDPKAAGKSRYAWVSWAHRLADAPAITTPLPPASGPPCTAVDSARTPASPATTSTVNNRFSMIRRLEQHEGLEFVVSWSVRRILLALLFVLVLSLAATLLWIFLGKNSHSPGQGAGFMGAGDRVVAGVVMGICVLLIGIAGIGGWIGVSWLVL